MFAAGSDMRRARRTCSVAQLDQIIDLNHALVKLAHAIDAGASWNGGLDRFTRTAPAVHRCRRG